MSIIRGTGDAKKMKEKGQVVGQTVATMKCTKCGQTAVQTRGQNGEVVYQCGACSTQFKLSRF